MSNDAEIERFFAQYSSKQRKWVEMSGAYQFAIRHRKTITALEIASVIISHYRVPGSFKQQRRDIALIFKKEFPEIDDIPN